MEMTLEENKDRRQKQEDMRLETCLSTLTACDFMQGSVCFFMSPSACVSRLQTSIFLTCYYLQPESVSR